MFQLSLEQGYSLLLLFAVAAGALTLTILFYRRGRRDLRGIRWSFLLCLRCLAIVLIVLLLFRPILTLQTETVDRHRLLLLVDTSASMSTADDPSGSTRWDQVRGKIEQWWPQLGSQFDVELMEFSDQARSLEDIDALTQLQPTGRATSLTRALQAARKQVHGTAGTVMLLTDGIHNAAGDPVQTARQSGLTIHTIGVGSNLRNSPSFRDVWITNLDCPPQLVLANRALLTAAVESVGFDRRVVKVQLEEDGKVIEQTDLTLTGSRGPQSVKFEFLPTKRGPHSYTIRIPPLKEEAIQKNNQRTALTQVVDIGIRVLYLEGALRAEYGALVERFLSRDPDIEFCALVQVRRNEFVQRTNIKDFKLDAIPSDPAILKRFNVFILGNLDSTFLKPAQTAALIEAVREGGGLVMLGGTNGLGPGGYGGTALEGILPVKVGTRDIGQVTESFLPMLTVEGRNHLIFTNIAGFFPSPGIEPKEKGLPPLLGCVRVEDARPSATVLAYYGIDKDAKTGMPVLAVQPVGKGRTAVFTGDTTRVWHQVPRALGEESPFTRFWGQLVRWLANRTEAVGSGASVIAQTPRAYYQPDTPIPISALVRDKQGEGASKVKVQARIKMPDQEHAVIPLTEHGGSIGLYEGKFDPKISGPYEFVVEAEVGDATVRSDKLIFEVGRPNLEFDRLDLDDRLLMSVAEASGGKYFHISTADRLLEMLQRQEQRRQVYLEQKLYWPVPFWVILVGALALEWGLRKRWQLR
jgi:uncharacterized membrane protein